MSASANNNNNSTHEAEDDGTGFFIVMCTYSFVLVTVGKQRYLAACKQHDIVPVSYLLKQLSEPTLNLNHRGLADKGTIALAQCLAVRIQQSEHTHAHAIVTCPGSRRNSRWTRTSFLFSCQTIGLENKVCISCSLQPHHSLILTSPCPWQERTRTRMCTHALCNTLQPAYFLSHHFYFLGAVALCQALKANTSIKVLDLSNNRYV